MQVKSIAECSREFSAILLTFIKLPFVIKIFVLSIFEWLFYTDFTQVLHMFYTDFTVCIFPDNPEETANNIQKNSALGYAYNRKFSSHFHNFVDICLEKDPNTRYVICY